MATRAAAATEVALVAAEMVVAIVVEARAAVRVEVAEVAATAAVVMAGLMVVSVAMAATEGAVAA